MGSYSLRIRRTVWAQLTRVPCVTIREISTITRLHVSTVQAAIRDLEEAGYIASDRDARGRRIAHARRVIVPLYTLPRRKAHPTAQERG